jgi:hypothetical protein
MAQVHTWQVGVHHVFYCMNKLTKAQMIHMCRDQLGRGHGPESEWYATHLQHPDLQFTALVPVIMVRDPQIATQLKLMFT